MSSLTLSPETVRMFAERHLAQAEYYCNHPKPNSSSEQLMWEELFMWARFMALLD